MVVGIPGILLAVVVRLTVAEPVRGLSESAPSNNDSAPFGEVLALLWRRRTFRHMAFGAALNAFAGYASASWTASFMIRSYDMSTGELGTWLAIISGACGAAAARASRSRRRRSR